MCIEGGKYESKKAAVYVRSAFLQGEVSHYTGLSLKGPFGELEHVVKVKCL